jgi:hypothetical protein
MIASSAAEADPHSIMGIGGNTCAVFAKEYQSNPQIENFYTTWAALSQYLEGVFALMKRMPKFKLKAH